MSERGPTGAEPPETEDDLRVSAPKTKAAGLPSIVSAFVHMHRNGRAIPSALRILSHMNQTDGFDCPGCAWPDPDDRAAVTEFCVVV